jgi:hypothetical protein
VLRLDGGIGGDVDVEIRDGEVEATRLQVDVAAAVGLER